ncbi:MAG TPA: AgmX/PglI C-terminal domain-containing protein [Polyangiaceae bacterium]|jgi:outer membrane biosynthesis protein TonB
MRPGVKLAYLVLPCALLAAACAPAGSPPSAPVILPASGGAGGSAVDSPAPGATSAAPAGSAAAAAAAPAPSSSGPPCSSACVGNGTPELAAAVHDRAAQAKPCYNRALTRDRTLRGTMRVLVRLRDDGSVCEARVLASDMPAETSECVRGLLGGASYPPPRDGCVDVEIPMTFQPRDAAATPAP